MGGSHNTMKQSITIIAVVLCTVAIAAASDDSAMREETVFEHDSVLPENEFLELQDALRTEDDEEVGATNHYKKYMDRQANKNGASTPPPPPSDPVTRRRRRSK